MKYFGSGASKWLSYPVASCSGSVLAVCSCTVLPLFAGIWKKGAGIGPATAFLYAGPAINVLAIIPTARVLGWELGLARTVGAVFFAVVIGLLMAYFCREEEEQKTKSMMDQMPGQPEETRTPYQNLLFFLVLIFILIFAAWSRPEQATGFWVMVFETKWYLVVVLLAILAFMVLRWFNRGTYFARSYRLGNGTGSCPCLVVGRTSY